MEILKKVDEDPKRKPISLAKELGLVPSTLSTSVGRRDVIVQNVQRFSADAKEAKTAHYVKVEDVLLTWLREAFLCVVSWRKSTEETTNLQISPLDARHFVAMAWDRVSASTITNCFAYCGVVESTVATLQASEDIENWDQLGIECSADDDLVTCGLRTVEEMDVRLWPKVAKNLAEGTKKTFSLWSTRNHCELLMAQFVHKDTANLKKVLTSYGSDLLPPAQKRIMFSPRRESGVYLNDDVGVALQKRIKNF
ncbi:hypothetical protein HPB49_002739 [Dermacentor silvarum]|uniref:Uncharacterized protein n=1 Tax=Dermacentor silvarum TaxID=543639 RepID=A0ACB8CD22_DERSI|nr:hypothetical protein HPB49_002739 [Dermacentor silvarum]